MKQRHNVQTESSYNWSRPVTVPGTEPILSYSFEMLLKYHSKQQSCSKLLDNYCLATWIQLFLLFFVHFQLPPLSQRQLKHTEACSRSTFHSTHSWTHTTLCTLPVLVFSCLQMERGSRSFFSNLLFHFPLLFRLHPQLSKGVWMSCSSWFLQHGPSISCIFRLYC